MLIAAFDPLNGRRHGRMVEWSNGRRHGRMRKLITLAKYECSSTAEKATGEAFESATALEGFLVWGPASGPGKTMYILYIVLVHQAPAALEGILSLTCAQGTFTASSASSPQSHACVASSTLQYKREATYIADLPIGGWPCRAATAQRPSFACSCLLSPQRAVLAQAP